MMCLLFVEMYLLDQLMFVDDVQFIMALLQILYVQIDPGIREMVHFPSIVQGFAVA